MAQSRVPVRVAHVWQCSIWQHGTPEAPCEASPKQAAGSCVQVVRERIHVRHPHRLRPKPMQESPNVEACAHRHMCRVRTRQHYGRVIGDPILIASHEAEERLELRWLMDKAAGDAAAPSRVVVQSVDESARRIEAAEEHGALVSRPQMVIL